MGIIIYKLNGQNVEKIGKWKEEIKFLGTMADIWIGLEQSKYTIKQVFENQKPPDSIEKITYAFHKTLSEQLVRRGQNWFAKTHKVGISYFCNDQKAFLWVNIYQSFISLKYFTGTSFIEGVKKANWNKGNDNKGSKPFRIIDETSIHNAVKYALKAYEIAANFERR